MSGYMMSDYDPYMLAEMVGQEYNPYQGYPLKQVSDQVWDVYGPTPDYLIAQQFGMMTPNRDKFSLDAFFAANPLLRGPLAQAMAASKGDVIGAYNEINTPDMQDQLRKEIGRTEWDQLAAEGDLRMLAAMTGKEKDQAGMDFYMRGLEDLLAQGAPTSQRNMQQYDYIAERMGGRTYPGAGQTPDYGQGSAPDPMADLAGGGGLSRVNIQDVGQDKANRDRLGFDAGAGQAYANIGGRRYAVRGTPEDRMALQQVIMERNQRSRKSEAEQVKKQKKNKDKGKVGRGLLDLNRMGTLIGF